MTRNKHLAYLLVVAALISVSVGLVGSRVALASQEQHPNLNPMQSRFASVHSGVLAAGKYSYIVAFSDNDQSTQNMQDPANGASFDASVPKVVAWLAIKRNDASAPATKFSTAIDFSSPAGLTISSTFSGGKDSITPGNQTYDQDSIVSKYVLIKGSANAKLLGTWSVSFSVGGQDLTTESFTLIKAGAPTNNGTPISKTTPTNNGTPISKTTPTNNGTPISKTTPTSNTTPTPTAGGTTACESTSTTTDPPSQVHSCLEGQGYDVLDTGQTTNQTSGKKIAYVFSDMADPNKDYYAAATSNQVFYSFEVLANAWPDSVFLAVELAYSKQFTIITAAALTDWQTFLKAYNPSDQNATTKAWQDFSAKMTVSIYDNDSQQFLTPQQTKDFATKNFGGGSSTNSGNDTGVPIGDPTHPANSSVSSVSVSADTIILPPDGSSTSQITVKVYDRQSNPLTNQEVSFSISGAAGGKLRPTSTSTDSKGMAQTTYTAGKTAGTVTIVAESQGVRGTVTIGLSGSDVPQNNTSDPAAAVKSDLVSKGYEVSGVGALKSDPTTVFVIMPRVSSTLDDNLVKQILLGWVSLTSNYPNAKNLLVVTSFSIQGTNYGVLWGISSSDFATLV
ncbi:MAG: hypothetical protein DLM69_00780, partial [Candidatus Chloroheliales bacterium]